jgi:hypothetical protein
MPIPAALLEPVSLSRGVNCRNFCVSAQRTKPGLPETLSSAMASARLRLSGPRAHQLHQVSAVREGCSAARRCENFRDTGPTGAKFQLHA